MVLSGPDNYRNHGVDSGAHSLTRTQMAVSVLASVRFCSFPMGQLFSRHYLNCTTAQATKLEVSGQSLKCQGCYGFLPGIAGFTSQQFILKPNLICVLPPPPYCPEVYSPKVEKKNLLILIHPSLLLSSETSTFSKPRSGSSVNILKSKFTEVKKIF